MSITVYRIRCSKEDKSYVGVTGDFDSRQYSHLYKLKNGTHENSFLQEAYNAHGEGSFSFEPLEENVDQSLRYVAEKKWIDSIGADKLYNKNIFDAMPLDVVNEKTFSERLSEIEEREGISGNKMAKLFGVTTSDYHGSLKTNKNPPTTCWRIALFFIDKYGIKDLVETEV